MTGYCKKTGTCVKFSGVKCDGCDAKDCYVWNCNMNVMTLIYIIIPCTVVGILLLFCLWMYCCCCRKNKRRAINVYQYKESSKDRKQRQAREERQAIRKQERSERHRELRKKYNLLGADDSSDDDVLQA